VHKSDTGICRSDCRSNPARVWTRTQINRQGLRDRRPLCEGHGQAKYARTITPMACFSASCSSAPCRTRREAPRSTRGARHARCESDSSRLTSFRLRPIPSPTMARLFRPTQTASAGSPWSRSTGEPILAVAAVDELTAAEAIEKIRIEFEPLPFVIDPLETLRPGGLTEKGLENIWVRPPAPAAVAGSPPPAPPPPTIGELKWTEADFAEAKGVRLPIGKTPDEWSVR